MALSTSSTSLHRTCSAVESLAKEINEPDIPFQFDGARHVVTRDGNGRLPRRLIDSLLYESSSIP